MSKNTEEPTSFKVGDFNSSYYVSDSERKSRKRSKKGNSQEIRDNLTAISNQSDHHSLSAANSSSCNVSTFGTAGQTTYGSHNIFPSTWDTQWTTPSFNNGLSSPITSDSDWHISLINNTNLKFMENYVKFFTLAGFEKTDLKVQVVKNQVQVRATRKPIKGFDPVDLDQVITEEVFQFDVDTYDAKKITVSFLNGILRIELPLLEDIVSEVAIA